jgi:uncharacterized protein
MILSDFEGNEFRRALYGWAGTGQALRMKDFVQHGTVSTYQHCMRVALTSYWLSLRLHIRTDTESMIRGAFLHDFYLYDWHHCTQITRWHGFTHPQAALRNAQAYYPLNEKGKNIIQSHMWPLTPASVPRCREAVIVCLADKICSLDETLFCRRIGT